MVLRWNVRLIPHPQRPQKQRGRTDAKEHIMLYYLTGLWFKAWIQIGRLLNPERKNSYVILMTGGLAAGKGTQADKLSQAMKFPALSSGALIRLHIAKGTEWGKYWAQQVTEGKFVTDAAIFQILVPEYNKPEYDPGVIFDGFPRTLAQAKKTRRMLAARGNEVNIVIYLKVSSEEVIKRLSGRLTCSDATCAKTYNIHASPPKVEDRCDNEKCNHAPLVQREDDRPDRIAVRIDEFNRTFEPMRAYYEKLGVLETIECTPGMTIDDVAELVKFKVHEVD
jgi:adenylate kinase